MADPITIQWGALATEIVKNIVVGSSAAAVTAVFLRRKQQAQPVPAPVPHAAAPAAGRCSSHVYIEHNIVYIKNCIRWQVGLLYKLCQDRGIEVPAEPMEEPVDKVKRGE